MCPGKKGVCQDPVWPQILGAFGGSSAAEVGWVSGSRSPCALGLLAVWSTGKEMTCFRPLWGPARAQSRVGGRSFLGLNQQGGPHWWEGDSPTACCCLRGPSGAQTPTYSTHGRPGPGPPRVEKLSFSLHGSESPEWGAGCSARAPALAS